MSVGNNSLDHDFVSPHMSCRSDLKNSSIVQEYVLPDLGQNRAGHIREKGSALDPQNPMEQVLLMGNERFAVPEVIFRPDDIGLDQAGLAQAVVQSIALLPQDLQGMFWANIGLVGGNIRLLGFKDRLSVDLISSSKFMLIFSLCQVCGTTESCTRRI